MTIQFAQTTLQTQMEGLLDYTRRLGLVDTYWEHQIFDARCYEIRIDSKPVGFCSLLEPEKAVTAFYLRDILSPFGQPVFAELLRQLRPQLAYVVTSDEPLLSLVMDQQTRISPQAYFFDDGGLFVEPPQFPGTVLRLAAESDLPELNESGFYGDTDLHDPDNLIYVLREQDGAFMGTGHIAYWMRKVGRDWGAIGMYTAPAYRKMGVGKSIILAMRQMVLEQGSTPIAGCNYHNLASKKTLESCGFISKTRYLKFYFE